MDTPTRSGIASAERHTAVLVAKLSHVSEWGTAGLAADLTIYVGEVSRGSVGPDQSKCLQVLYSPDHCGHRYGKAKTCLSDE